MIAYALTFAMGCLSLALLMNLWRLLRGPLLTDRILALDTMAINAIALIVLAGIHWSSTLYFEAALLNRRPRGAVLTTAEVRVISDDTAVVAGLDRLSGVVDGRTVSTSGRVTFVVARRGGDWKIVHFHRSVAPP